MLFFWYRPRNFVDEMAGPLWNLSIYLYIIHTVSYSDPYPFRLLKSHKKSGYLWILRVIDLFLGFLVEGQETGRKSGSPQAVLNLQDLTHSNFSA